MERVRNRQVRLDRVLGRHARHRHNIIWFVEQCLSNTLRLETYVADAERENDRELVDFFRRAQETSRKGAEQGKELLAKRLTS